MRRAAELALRGRGATAPNPCVGAVLVKGDAIVAEGWHQFFGGPHAEVNCLADARARGVDPAGCDLYVTLEPCNHYGKTPPCAKAVVEAGIKRVFVGCCDPNAEACGGADTLRAAGVEVVTGVEEALCRDIIDEFVLWQTTKRSYNILKMASTIDGKIAARGGRPEAVSGEQSMYDVHRIRSRVRAVIVGGNTFYGDNPQLTCRLKADDMPQGFRQPYAVIVTGKLPKAYSTFTILRQRPQDAIFWTTEYAATTPLADELRERGTRIWALPELPTGSGGWLDFAPAFERLRQELSCCHTLCEGGGHLALSLCRQGLVDEFVHYVAPRVLGDEEGKSLFAGMSAQSMAQALSFRLAHADSCGDDLKLTYKPRRAA